MNTSAEPLDTAATRIVELRIHGVSGTPPESMLRTAMAEHLAPADVEQVAGDELTGFYRVTTTALPPDPEHILEAYNWGQLTSGTWKKALWLLLVPFGLLNAAHFMLPGITPRRPALGGALAHPPQRGHRQRVQKVQHPGLADHP